MFPSLVNTRVKYLGVYHPRDERPSFELYSRFCEAVDSGEEIYELRTLLEQELSAGVSLVLSEEMFTVSSGKLSWRVKLSNLSRIIGGLDYALILTVREPSTALFSYYCELYPRFRDRYANFVECALHDEGMEIFHYQKLMEEIMKNYEKKRITVLRFEDIVKNKIERIYEIIPTEKRLADVAVLAEHNKRVHNNNVVLTRYKLSVGDFLRKLSAISGLRNAKRYCQFRKKLHHIVILFDRMQLKQVKIKKPTPYEMQFLKMKLSKETIALYENFKIRFD